MTLTMFAATYIALLTLTLLVDMLARTRMRKVGGIWFWKVGRLGGSFYLSASEAIWKA